MVALEEAAVRVVSGVVKRFDVGLTLYSIQRAVSCVWRDYWSTVGVM